MTYENRYRFLKITPKFGSTHNGCRKLWKRLVIKALQNVLTFTGLNSTFLFCDFLIVDMALSPSDKLWDTCGNTGGSQI